MKWYKEFSVNMPQNLKSVCNSYTDVFEYEPIWTYESVEDSKMWVIPPLGKNRTRLDDRGASDKLANIRELVTTITELYLEEETPILAIWRFDEKFPHCPVHIDQGGEHTGSVVTCISGNFKIHLHAADEPDSPIIESVNINGQTLVALNNTVFPHSVEGIGDLVVFGTAVKTDTKEYFKNA